MKNIVLNGLNYSIEKDYKNSFNLDEVKDRCIDAEYFNEFDYIFGDYAYNKLRIKGFYDKNNSKVSELNNIDGLENYLNNYCAYNCGYFLLKKINN